MKEGLLSGWRKSFRNWKEIGTFGKIELWKPSSCSKMNFSPCLFSGGANAEQHASGLALKLQLLTHELANSLEQVLLHKNHTCWKMPEPFLDFWQANEQAIRNMPRVAHDLEFLQKDAATLRQTLSDIKSGLETTERKTESSVKTLGEIDRVKGRMEERFDGLLLFGSRGMLNFGFSI